MYSVAAVALFALAIAAAAPAAFAEDRGAKVDTNRHADSELHTDNVSAAAETDDTLAASGACPRPAHAAAEGCQGAKPNGSGLIREVDWSAVGPSTDDFATTDDTLRLKGARLIATYRF